MRVGPADGLIVPSATPKVTASSGTPTTGNRAIQRGVGSFLPCTITVKVLWSERMTIYFTILASMAILWSFAVVSPGPNFLITARISITRPRREGLLAVAGIGIGTAVWSAAGCLGVEALFIAAPWMYMTIRLLGGAYLTYMGALLIWRSGRSDGTNGSGLPRCRLKASAFHIGLLATIANPKSAISVASIFATTMPAHPPFGLSVAVIVTMIAISVAWYYLVACLFTTRQPAGAYQRCRRRIDRLTGVWFILFSARLEAEK
jgi:threonine/homoserine/homoserine lactone efflux protein